MDRKAERAQPPWHFTGYKTVPAGRDTILTLTAVSTGGKAGVIVRESQAVAEAPARTPQKGLCSVTVPGPPALPTSSPSL